MIEPLVITVKLTRQDIIRARLFVYFRSGFGVAITGAAILFSLLNGFLATRPEVRSASALPPWFPAFLGLLVIPCAVAFAGINGRVMRALLSAPLRYEIFDSGFLFESPAVTAEVPWTQVARAYESRQQFVLSTPGALQVLPKRFLSSIDEARLASVLRAALGDRARLRARG